MAMASTPKPLTLAMTTEKMTASRRAGSSKASPDASCLPGNLPFKTPVKPSGVHTAALIAILYEHATHKEVLFQ
eukprot:1143517-Pelagomonas_calceolata.AAC.4